MLNIITALLISQVIGNGVDNSVRAKQVQKPSATCIYEVDNDEVTMVVFQDTKDASITKFASFTVNKVEGDDVFIVIGFMNIYTGQTKLSKQGTIEGDRKFGDHTLRIKPDDTTFTVLRYNIGVISFYQTDGDGNILNVEKIQCKLAPKDKN